MDGLLEGVATGSVMCRVLRFNEYRVVPAKARSSVVPRKRDDLLVMAGLDPAIHVFVTVIAGLDPAIHPLGRLSRRWMDTRVKPAYDGASGARLCISHRSFLQASVIAARKFLQFHFVVPAKAGTQYSGAIVLGIASHQRSRILGRPVEPGDDGFAVVFAQHSPSSGQASSPPAKSFT
jgi:hypothetical protein